MTEPMSEARLAEVRRRVNVALPGLHDVVDEIDRLRAELAARPEPIGYVVARRYPSGAVNVRAATDSLDDARDAAQATEFGTNHHVCALVPIEPTP